MDRTLKLTVLLALSWIPLSARAAPPIDERFPPIEETTSIDIRRLPQRLEDRVISERLGRYFTHQEIESYERTVDEADLRPMNVGIEEVNRLTDPSHNRCGNDVIAVGECVQYQALAWNNGNGCINATEYNYALANAIAPLCSPFNATMFLGWCRCGCFEKTTTLRTLSLSSGQEQEALVSEIDVDSHEVFAMTEASTLSAIRLEPRPLTATTVGDEELPLVWVHLANGTALGLTTEHAVLLSSGVMVPAKALTASDVLVSENGQAVAISSIERLPTSDPVYNVLTDAGLQHKGHIVSANGVLVGDIMWQNTLAADLGDVIVRE